MVLLQNQKKGLRLDGESAGSERLANARRFEYVVARRPNRSRGVDESSRRFDPAQLAASDNTFMS